MTSTTTAPPPAPPPVPAATPPQKSSSGCLKWGLIGCGIVIVLGAIVACVIVFGAFAAMKRTDVYKGALERAQNDPRVVAALGSPVNSGWWMSGRINKDTRTGGDADLHIPISGPKAKGELHAVATIENGKWVYETLTVTPEGGTAIDLNTPP